MVYGILTNHDSGQSTDQTDGSSNAYDETMKRIKSDQEKAERENSERAVRCSAYGIMGDTFAKNLEGCP